MLARMTRPQQQFEMQTVNGVVVEKGEIGRRRKLQETDEKKAN